MVLFSLVSGAGDDTPYVGDTAEPVEPVEPVDDDSDTKDQPSSSASKNREERTKLTIKQKTVDYYYHNPFWC